MQSNFCFPFFTFFFYQFLQLLLLLLLNLTQFLLLFGFASIPFHFRVLLKIGLLLLLLLLYNLHSLLFSVYSINFCPFLSLMYRMDGCLFCLHGIIVIITNYCYLFCLHAAAVYQ